MHEAILMDGLQDGAALTVERNPVDLSRADGHRRNHDNERRGHEDHDWKRQERRVASLQQAELPAKASMNRGILIAECSRKALNEQ
ncbi:MAG: hypothetical protein ACK4TP_18880 [Hyphomicrobium sp.]